MSTLSWDTNGCTTVGNTVGEGVDATSFMAASETQGVILAVHSDMLLVTALKLLDRSFDVFHSTWFAHVLAGEVAVETCSIPVTWDWFGVE